MPKPTPGTYKEEAKPFYREESTPWGTFGIPPNHELTFEMTENGPAPVLTEAKSTDEDVTFNELMEDAKKLKVKGRSSMNKEELAEAVAAAKEAAEEDNS